MSKSKAQRTESSPVGKIEWLDDVAEHDYAAAEAYLSIKLDQPVVAKSSGGSAKRRSRPGARTTSSVLPD
jgi:hypothetical protein